MINLAVVLDETTTAAEVTTVFTDGTVVGTVIDWLLVMAKDFVNLLRDFKFYGEVSYFDFFLALAVMSIVIVYLVNVARSPGVETTSGRYAKENRKRERDEFYSYKKQAYKEYLNNRGKIYKEYLNNRGKK